jgi:hypothetical protein
VKEIAAYVRPRFDFTTEKEKREMIEAKEKKEIKAPSLYELTNDLQALLDFGFTEEDEEVFLDTLDVLMDSIQDKADGYCAVIDRFNGNIDMIKAEEERLKVRREIIEKRVQTMKNALKEVLEIVGSDEVLKERLKAESMSFNPLSTFWIRETAGNLPSKKPQYYDATSGLLCKAND